VPTFVASNVAELELWRDGRRGKVLSMAAKYWPCILCLEFWEKYDI
jgi:hypothetical protein